jgi:hypothetical protein
MSLLGTVFAFGGCNFGEFTASSTVTLDGREVVSSLIRGLILTPIESAIDASIDRVFDQFDDDDD